jgi:uncharacterized protein
MRIKVSEIPDEGLERVLGLPIVLEKGGPDNIAGVKIRFLKFGDRVLVEGEAEMTASLSCSRCLVEYSYPLHVSFRDEYLPEVKDAKGGEHRLSGNELDVGYYINDEIDIEDIIKEQMLLVIPIKRLCKDACKGLCPECGQNLNTGSCKCKKEKIDPRLAKLSELKERLKK